MSNSVDAAIDYFIKKKFGFISSIATSMASIKPNERNVFSDKKSEIEAYKLTLRNIPESELLTLHKKSLLEDAEQHKRNVTNVENSRFYNQKSANADYVHWSKAAHWTLDEAIALSFGKEPEIVNWKKIEPLKDTTEFAKSFAKRRDLALRATRWKKFSNEAIPPVLFISWAKEVKIELPNDLISELGKIGHTATNWREQYYNLKSEFDALAKSIQTTDNTQKSENLLKAIACIAIDAYGYDPKSAKSTAPKDICEALKRQGQTLDPKTIRNWLKEGIEILPRKPS